MNPEIWETISPVDLEREIRVDAHIFFGAERSIVGTLFFIEKKDRVRIDILCRAVLREDRVNVIFIVDKEKTLYFVYDGFNKIAEGDRESVTKRLYRLYKQKGYKYYVIMKAIELLDRQTRIFAHETLQKSL